MFEDTRRDKPQNRTEAWHENLKALDICSEGGRRMLIVGSGSMCWRMEVWIEKLVLSDESL